MSVVKEVRPIDTEVMLLKCDGPRCTKEYFSRTDLATPIPSGWYSVYTPGKEPEMVHFHDLGCLRAWASGVN